MKRYLSVFEMITRCSIYKVLGILLLMGIAEAVALLNAWNQPLASMQPNLEEWIDQSCIVATFGLAYMFVTKVLSTTGTNVGSMQGYTFQRLRIPEKKIHLLQCIYNMLCYVLLWAAQLGILLIASQIYMQKKTNVILTNQTVLLAFYRNKFMHAILPLHDIFGWFVLFFLITGTGILVAAFSKNQRKGSLTWSLIVFMVMAFVIFLRDLGEEGLVIFIITLMLIWFLFAIVKIWLNKGVQENE